MFDQTSIPRSDMGHGTVMDSEPIPYVWPEWEGTVMTADSTTIGAESSTQPNQGQQPQNPRATGGSPKGGIPCPEPGCTKISKDKHALNHHLRYHRKPFVCDHRDHSQPRAFSLEKDLIRHQQVHLTENSRERYHCEYPGCGESFTRADNRSRHMKKHLQSS